MDLVSVGDHVEDGEYVLHSRFSKALNFRNVHQRGIDSSIFPLLTCVTQDVGAGPTNIVFRSFQKLRGNSCSVSHNCFVVGDQKYVFDASMRYRSSSQISGIPYTECLDHLNLFENELVRQASPKSLVFLLRPDTQQSEFFGFEQALRQRCQASVQELLSGNITTGVRLMKGVGVGLTPGGDDFLTGLLLGLWFMQQLDSRAYAALRDCIYSAALGQNLLSNTFLYCAKEGWLFERWQYALKFLASDETVSELAVIIRELLTAGETSGADTAAGLVFALRNAGTLNREP